MYSHPEMGESNAKSQKEAGGGRRMRGTKIKKTNNNDFISISDPQMFASFLSLSCQMEISSLVRL